MKNFIATLFILFSVVTVSHAAGTNTIKNGLLQSDLNGGGHVIKNVTDVQDANGNSLLGAGGGGSGNVTGPGSSSTNNLAAYNSSTGTLLKDSGVAIANLVLQSLFQSFTNSLGGAAFKGTNTFDLAGTAAAGDALRPVFNQTAANVFPISIPPTNNYLTVFSNSIANGQKIFGVMFDDDAFKAAFSFNIGDDTFVYVVDFQDFTNALAMSAYGDASALSLNNIPNPRVATNDATASDGQVLSRTGGKMKWISVSGGGDMLRANNLSDVANALTALANIGGISNSYALVWTNAGWYMTNKTGWSFWNTNGLAIVSNAVTATARVWDTNNNLVIWNNGSMTLSNNAASGNTTFFGSITNVGPVSFKGNTTNFANAYFKGNITGDGSFTITGNITNLASGYFGALIYNSTPYGDTNMDGGWTSSYIYDADLTASSLLKANANKKLSSISNGTGALTNDSSGNFGYAPLLDASQLKASQYAATDANTNLVSTQNGNNWTNYVAYTHEGTTTNISIAFNGTIQSFTVTNGPDVWLNWSGANGSAAVQFLTNCSIHSSTTFNKFLAGSNGVSAGVYKITNGWFTVTSAGGTNGTQLSPAIVENQ